ncbi:polymer-forming cytoskeletal protein [Halomarina salina]|uniref:Polymer-forming cytoskeletal protein n=1 Tax=Halomarina salina TaxID=1872699 RepID=A0ABD5RN17_9EURY|nr:polymer-forming cytoskeletal protein [Halomarina salina]
MNLTPVTVLLVVAVLLAAAAGGEDVDSMRVVLDEEHVLDGPTETVLVAGGAVTTDGPVDGSVYVADGSVDVASTVRGDVVVLGGDVRIAPSATVTGTVQAIGGDVTVAEGASVGSVERGVPAEEAGTSPVGFALQTLVLAAVGALLADRRPRLLGTVGDAATTHPLVSGVVGALSTLAALAMTVLLAFTVVLLPVSVLAVLVGAVVVGYAVAVFGALLGRRLPVDSRPVAAAAGVVGVEALLVVLPRVPVVGSLAALALLAVGVGAVLVTGFGLRRFEPPALE